jgi:hypothetical protein
MLKRLHYRRNVTRDRRFIDNADIAQFRERQTPVYFEDALVGSIEKPDLELCLAAVDRFEIRNFRLLACLDSEERIDRVDISLSS